MKINSEFDLIEKFKTDSEKHPRPESLIEGIGDDCAAFKASKDRISLITTDMSVEGTHFIRDISTPFETGWKCMTANLSDIAAMGGVPIFAFISVGLPPDTDEDYASELFRGLNRCAAEWGAYIAGGDTTRSEKVVISVTIYGEAGPDSLITRRGAAPGDSIFTTGPTGDSTAGLELLKEKGRAAQELYPSLVKKHLAPDPRSGAVQSVLSMKPTAMIDLSDGLVSDLKHICEASQTGFILTCEDIPLSEELIKYCSDSGKDPLQYALTSGEEYELIFTAKDTAHPPLSDGDLKIKKIGRITEKDYLISEKGSIKSVDAEGFDHFNMK